MMIGAYSSPAHGYMSLDPIRDLGNDPVVALWRSGVRSGQGVPAAKGWAMLILGDGEPRAVRISARSAQDARRTAARELAGAEVVLLEGVYRGRVTVFRRTEILRAMSVSKAAGDDTVQLVGSSGVLIGKSLSPADPVDARLIARRLAGQLRHQERLVFGPKLKAYMEKLNVDWANMDATATSRALAKIRTDMRAMVGPAARKLMPTWKITVESTVTKVFSATRKVVRDNFLPSVGLSLRQPDLVAVRTIADQQGWWMRDAAGVRSDQLTKKARGIVQQGLKDGLGRIEIASSLRTALPKAWQAMGARYFNAVASVAVSRARSYSEVSGYVEVGIEALEVQAVLDSRTTDVCRCLDGQIIDTHVVSQQIVGAMNVATPEDIKTASPFIRQVLNRETGVKSLVTTSGVKIADIVRSGMGRENDRGQFNRYRANNQLADANIGPPPYHHLCRSWTIPVTSTVQVPRGKTGRASGPAVPPRSVPPKALPKRRPMPFMPTGAKVPASQPLSGRPITGVPAGSPSNPALVGERAEIDRLAFPDDFVHAEAPASMMARSPKSKMLSLKQNDAVLYRPYQVDNLTAQIRASSDWKVIARPKGDPARIFREGREFEKIRRKMDIRSADVGIAVEVDGFYSRVMKELVLNETAGQAGVRAYSVRGVKRNVREYWRFDHNKKGAARKYIKDLRAAKNPKAVEEALVGLEKKGFLKRSAKPDLFFGGTTPQPSAAPKIKPRAKPKPKPSPFTSPVRPKPKPKVTYPNIPGQPIAPKPKPKPKPTRPVLPEGANAKDYSQYGLLKDTSLHRQVVDRISIETAKIEQFMAAEQKKLGRVLTRKEKGKALKKMFREQVRPDNADVTSRTLMRQRQQQKLKELKDAKQMAMNDHSKEISKLLRRDMDPSQFTVLNGEKLEEAWKQAMEYVGPRLQNAAMNAKMPAVITRAVRPVRGIKAAQYEVRRNFVQVVGRSAKEMDSLIKHEVSHFLDTLGRNDQATKMARRIWSRSDKVYTGGTYDANYDYLRGKWGDKYCGRIYSGSGTEMNSVMAEAFAKGNEAKLGKLYESNPEHVGFYMSYVRGAFI